MTYAEKDIMQNGVEREKDAEREREREKEFWFWFLDYLLRREGIREAEVKNQVMHGRVLPYDL